MGEFLNPDEAKFEISLNSKIYVDKSEMIEFTNSVFRTEQRFMCVSRPRRFGKTMDINMLASYYSKGADGLNLFKNLKISKSDVFEKYLNKLNVIQINIVDLFADGRNLKKGLLYLKKWLIDDLITEYEEIKYKDKKDLYKCLTNVFQAQKQPFVFLIDEWDYVFRNSRFSSEDQREYLDFLRNLLKDKAYVGLAYMTGILPIKKYGEHSALNMFNEYSMTNQRELSKFTGFTESEVKRLCETYGMSFEETKEWYDGYNLKGISIYNPRSVVESLLSKNYSNYWAATETYEALKVYLQMNMDGLKDKITCMIAGEEIKINPLKFQNDMSSFKSADDILTLLVHLGYLAYNEENNKVCIPNSEIQQEFINSIEENGWEDVINAIKNSESLLKATLEKNEKTVAEKIEKVHEENISVIKYNDENSLSNVITLAYYTARKDYNIYRELPTGKGYADLVFIPKKNRNLPALIIELKWNQDEETAVKQIKNNNYPEKLEEHKDNLLIVGINYDKKNKKHKCKIESFIKSE